MFRNLDQKALSEAWAKFIYEDCLDSCIRYPISHSWKKCKEIGVDHLGGSGRLSDKALFKSILETNRSLIQTAVPIMQSVFEIVEKTGSVIVLTDSLGYILTTLGNSEMMSHLMRINFLPGALWSASEVGTNAISVALDYGIPIQLYGAEHYCRNHHDWVCSAAPIRGADGEIVGCLDLSGKKEIEHPHSLATVIASAFGIESQLKLRDNARMMQSVLESSSNGIVLLGENKGVIWSNSRAQDILGYSETDIKTLDFCKAASNIDWESLDAEADRQFFSNDIPILSKNGYIRCSVSVFHSIMGDTRALTVSLSKQKHLIRAVNKMSGNRALFSFEDFLTSCPNMKKTIALAQKYANYDGNILIEGEPGSGKERIAQAIHNASSRSKGPFVSVDCASLTRENIEAELFGYETGAFSGRARDSNPGRFELADKGTIYLDGVDQLPLEFQPKLINVVEKHNLSRLGSVTDMRLDIRIIASCRQSLSSFVKKGDFIPELYYGLNVLRLELPPLRERVSDIELYARHIIDRLNEANPEIKKTVSDDFISGLKYYYWPGNIRELQNSLERTFYSSQRSDLTRESLHLVFGESEIAEGKASKESAIIIDALKNSGGSVENAAKTLQISRATLYRRLKKLSLDPKQYR